MHSKYIILVLVALMPLAISLAVPLRNFRGPVQASRCETGDESGAPIPVNIIVPACDAPPCMLRKGETYRVEIDFDVPRNTNNLTVEVTGIIEGLELPWNGVKENGCDDILVGRCPMTEGDYWTYGVDILVQAIYPATPLIIKWQMRDDSEQAIWCFHLPAEIVN
ncbi:NPC intracellular cholesterol transporter 2 [Folsomia candida]|nr:NPC intracellular cholesterol transporter 2 [Folsomia candida]